jgi:ABC-2 type transport system ATP-binding protein
MTVVIEAKGLTKTFGRTKALDGLDLSVESGTVHGFIGPNGAGKSTTIRALLGLIRCKGRATLLGGDPWKDAVALHRRLAYVPGDVALWPNLTGGQAIDILTSLRGDRDPQRIAAVTERFGLDPTKKSRAYSKGNRQKVALVAALASRAELLILDEPTSGLDPLMERVFQECIEEVRSEGRTVLLSSHIFEEVERLADVATIIKDGRTVEVAQVQGSTDLEARFLAHYRMPDDSARQGARHVAGGAGGAGGAGAATGDVPAGAGSGRRA